MRFCFVWIFVCVHVYCLFARACMCAGTQCVSIFPVILLFNDRRACFRLANSTFLLLRSNSRASITLPISQPPIPTPEFLKTYKELSGEPPEHVQHYYLRVNIPQQVPFDGEYVRVQLHGRYGMYTRQAPEVYNMQVCFYIHIHV